MTIQDAWTTIDTTWGRNVQDITERPPRWIAENGDLRAAFPTTDWSEYRTLRLRMTCARRTAARILLEMLGPEDTVIGRTTFAADWVGDNDMQLWLNNLEPRDASKDWSRVCGLRLTCEQPGLWPTLLTLENLQVSRQSPSWRVNESDTIIEMGWHHLAAHVNEWSLFPEGSRIPAGSTYTRWPAPMSVINRQAKAQEPAGAFIRPPSPWISFGYHQGEQPGRLTVERRFNLDLSAYSQILAKMAWDQDTRLTVVAIVDQDRQIPLIENGTPCGEWLTFGAPLDGAQVLRAIRLTMEEQAGRSYQGRDIEMGLFWILLRQPTPLDEAPVKAARIRLVPTHKPYPEQVEIVERAIPQIPFPKYPESTTPIGDPLAEGLPYGFFVRRQDLPGLRERALYGVAAPIFRAIRAEADRALDTELVDRNYYGSAFGGGLGHPKGLRGAGMRVFAPIVAITHLITGDPRYAIAARRWILRAARSDDWRGDHGGCVDRPQIGEQLPYWDSFTGWFPKGFAGYMNHPFQVADPAFGIVVAYDMLYHCFSPAERDEVERAFAEHGVYILYDKLCQNRAFYVSMNQGILFALPLLMQTAFLQHRDPAYREMHRWTLEFLREFSTRPWSEEGVCGEGPGYGIGTLGEYVEALPIIAAVAGSSVRKVAPLSLRNVLEYAQHVRSTRWADRPRFISLSDGSDENWLGGETLAFFANYLQDPVAQYFWDESYASRPPSNLTTLLFLGDHIQPASPNLPPAKVFYDQPMAFLRTGWRHGDTLLAMTNIRQVTGHGHKDRASIILEYNREALLLDPGMIGYSDPASNQYAETFCHNTLTFDQCSQSSGTAIYDTSIAGFISTSGETCPGLPGGIDWVIADATAVYPQATRFVRHILYLRPDLFVLLDEVTAKEPERIELNFTCLGPLTISGNVVTSTTRRNRLLIQTLASQPLADHFSRWGTHWPDTPSYRLIRGTTAKVQTCTFLTVLAPHALGAPPPTIEPLAIEGVLGVRVRAGDREEWVLHRLAPDAALPGVDTDARACLVRYARGKVVAAAMQNGTRLACDNLFLVGAGNGLAGVRL